MSVVPRFSTCPAHRFRRPHSVRRRLAPALAGLAAQIALLGVPESAQACGGLFCSASAPVNQAAERIIFAKGSDGTVTQVVEILYEGPSEEFAWVLPVPGVPEFDVSSTVAFDRLQQATNPTYTLVDDQPDSCGGGFFRGSDDAEGAPVLSGAPNDPEVTVLDAGTVGPFDYEVIKVDAADEDAATVAVEWLEANDYDVGALGPEVLRPYLANGMNLLAFKLTKGTDTGAIQPVRLTFESETPSIPIRPTAVAAAENMGILVWVLGDVRAVPINYKGLELNELLINWFNPGPTYDAVVTAAANEAQGQGFVTEMAGSTAGMATTIDRGEESQLINPRPLEESIVSWAQFFGSYDGVERAFEAEVTVRAGLTIQDLLSCPNCYFDPEAYDFTETDYGTYNSATDPIQETDVDRLATALFQEVVNPIQKTAELFETQPLHDAALHHDERR